MDLIICEENNLQFKKIKFQFYNFLPGENQIFKMKWKKHVLQNRICFGDGRLSNKKKSITQILTTITIDRIRPSSSLL